MKSLRKTGDFTFPHTIRKKNKLFIAFLFKKIFSIQKFIVILQREMKKKPKTNQKQYDWTTHKR